MNDSKALEIIKTNIEVCLDIEKEGAIPAESLEFIQALVHAAKRLRDSCWQPIETAPRCLPINPKNEVWLGCTSHGLMTRGFVYESGAVSAVGYSGYEWDVWMPLPKAPNA